jgi:hypothetical protein
MPLETPRYSTEPHCEVYHNHTDCTEANNIEKKYFKWGTGGKRICHHCERLANQDGMIKSALESAAIVGGLFGGIGVHRSPLPLSAMMSAKKG